MITEKQAQADHEYLRTFVDPVFMPLIETLLLHQPQCLYEFICDYTSDRNRSDTVEPAHKVRSLRNHRHRGNRKKMIDYMATNVIPVMDHLAHQIIHQKPTAVLEYIRKVALACLELEKKRDFQVGERILCRYKGRPRFRTGQITCVSEDGESCDVLYDDGRREHNVHRVCLKRDITIMPSDKAEQNSCVSSLDSQPYVKAVEIVLLMLGLDGAGKTTLLSTLRGDKEIEHVPSIGFSSAKFEIAQGLVTFYDLGGGPSFRDIWKEYYADVHGIIFVVDTSHKDRVNEAAPILHEALDNTLLQQKPFLIFANKQDASTAVCQDEIAELLSLGNKCSVKVELCVAKPSRSNNIVDQRLENGLQWLFQHVTQDYQRLNARVLHDLALKKKKDSARKEAQRLRVACWKEERERCQMLLQDTKYQELAEKTALQTSNSEPTEAVMCYTCSVEPAITKSASSKWMPICSKCIIVLNTERAKPER